MRAGPKATSSMRALPGLPATGSPGEVWAEWCARWLRVPRGVGAGGPLQPRLWQVAVVDQLLDPPTRLALLVCGRGNGKSGMAAALGLHHVLGAELGRTAAVIATDERGAQRVLRWAVRCVEMSPSLSKRCQVYADRVVVPRTGSELLVLPAEARRIEGADIDLAVVDELGFVERDVWESALLSLKRPGARAFGIGTPPKPAWQERSPLADLVIEARLGVDPALRLVEYGSDLSHELDCEHCWAAANPALGDLLPRDQMASSLPPKTREAEYRRARLGQWVEQDSEGFLPAATWAECAEPGPIQDGAEVTLGLDGSFSGDCTALVACTVSPRPHLDVVGMWAAPDGDADWRVPIVDVETAVLDACRRWRVREVTADPFRWQRSLEVLAAQGVPVTEHPQTSSRMSPLTASFREAVVNRQLTHSGNVDLARHLAHAVLRDDSRGVRITKPSKHSTRRIDLAVAALMGYGRAVHYARTTRPRSRMVVLP